MEETTERKEVEAKARAEHEERLISLLSKTTECLERLTGVAPSEYKRRPHWPTEAAPRETNHADALRPKVVSALPEPWQEDSAAEKQFGKMIGMPLKELARAYSLTPDRAEEMGRAIETDLQQLSKGAGKPIELNIENLLHRTVEVDANVQQRLAQLLAWLLGQSEAAVNLDIVAVSGSAAIDFTHGRFDPKRARLLMEKLCSDC